LIFIGSVEKEKIKILMIITKYTLQWKYLETVPDKFEFVFTPKHAS